MTNDIVEQILDVVAEKAMVPRDQLRLEAKLAELNISSLDVVEIVFALEDKFQIQLPFNANSNSQEFETLGQVVTLVQQQIQAKGAA